MHPLQPNTCYHIFNHAIGFENIFRNDDNFRFFLEKYRKYITPVAETYAYCLMPNHFHLVIRILKRNIIEEWIQNKNNPFPTDNFSNDNFSKVLNFGKVENSKIEKFLSKQFANLFSCYTQAFNKVNNRKGSLFIKNFKRDPILIKEHFINAIIYTHRNPIHYEFCNNYRDWPYSSYSGILTSDGTITVSQKLLKMFGSLDLFIQQHTDSFISKKSGLFETP